jgi:hypothetical protein
MNARELCRLLLLCAFLAFPALPAMGVSEPPADSCYVYPAPVQGTVAVAVYRMPSAGKAHVQVFNESGDLVLDSLGSKPEGIQGTTLNLAAFHRGVYLCRVVVTASGGAPVVLKPFKFVVLR